MSSKKISEPGHPLDQSLGQPLGHPPGCPNCGKPRHQRYRPFCSKRCRDLDLARWLDGSYAVPAVEGDEDDDQAG